jgi:hypothetical protein
MNSFWYRSQNMKLVQRREVVYDKIAKKNVETAKNPGLNP